ncbi:LON peptidase substrate-binding domain-containing protein [Flocculibacter collagenilyticus]|uniref:LON peptidase substrate-binding domain-containing protein n=1 Tax=Flocculibacter collagenilyticus TaxID=2744479 RepID=UPI0018F57075|nr:LON peptidase substrate-binding domain-containing protein [Flocculibacter collagenilyticus]
MSTQTIPLFPLNAHIFPGGKLKLRIFEARYLRMVRENASNIPAFAMGMMSSKPNQGQFSVLSTATLVKIIDFEQLSDGLLGITIEGIELVCVSNIIQDDDGLRHANYQPIAGWNIPSSQLPYMLSSVNEEKEKVALQQSFSVLLSEYPDLAMLYANDNNMPLVWYAARWLEVLPLDAEEKAELITHQSPAPAINVIYSFLKKMDP